MDELQVKELKEIIERLEKIGETLHPNEARRIDEAVLILEKYLN